MTVVFLFDDRKPDSEWLARRPQPVVSFAPGLMRQD
jgi:hypothetical protein